MSISKQTTVWCDREGCVEWFAADVGTARDARQEAHAALGWEYVNRKDLCGYHARKLAPS